MPTERFCPNGCGELEPHTEVDIGVGVQTFGPWGCPVCHYIEDDQGGVMVPLGEPDTNEAT